MAGMGHGGSIIYHDQGEPHAHDPYTLQPTYRASVGYHGAVQE